MTKHPKKKDSWSTTSSSRSSSSRSRSSSTWSQRSKNKSRSYSDFNSESEEELKRNTLGSDESLRKKSPNKSVASIGSCDSVASSQSNKSRLSMSRVAAEFLLPKEDLPLNVLQLLLSLRESEINVKNLKLKHESNLKKVINES